MWSDYPAYAIIEESSELDLRYPDYYENSRGQEVKRFNSDGNLVEVCDYDPSGNLEWRYIYKYLKNDENENWLVQEMIEDIVNVPMGYVGTPNKIRERVIEYY
jgi:hypothetical protein